MRQVEFEHFGLNITAQMDEGDPGIHTYNNGDPGYPGLLPECDKFSWSVREINEFLMWALGHMDEEFNSVVDEFQNTGELPQYLVTLIERDWSDEIRSQAVLEYAENPCDE